MLSIFCIAYPGRRDTVPYQKRHQVDTEATAKEEVPMSRQDQIRLLKRLLHYVDNRTTAMADQPWCNEVSAYTDPERLANEQRVLFRQHPILMGFASEWSSPGSFRTDDYAGVPILVVRGRD